MGIFCQFRLRIVQSGKYIPQMTLTMTGAQNYFESYKILLTSHLPDRNLQTILTKDGKHEKQ